MEIFVLLLLVGLIWALVRSAKAKKAKAEQDTAQAQVELEARISEENALEEKISRAGTPEKILALCPHPVPREVRLMKSENAAWVVPDCGYVRTVKEVSYSGGSRGVSFRVVKGVSVRTSGSRGRREENEFFRGVDEGTVVLTDRHLYFSGTDKERFRVRLDKLVTAEAVSDGFRFQRDGVRARPEGFVSPAARMLAFVLEVIESGHTTESKPEQTPVDHNDGSDVIGAHQADSDAFDDND